MLAVTVTSHDQCLAIVRWLAAAAAAVVTVTCRHRLLQLPAVTVTTVTAYVPVTVHKKQ
jgi:hypothetical protein